jgi:polyhydroxybutyrate depolymerase
MTIMSEFTGTGGCRELVRHTKRGKNPSVSVFSVSVLLLLATGGAVVGAYDVTTVDLGRGPVSVFVPDGYRSDTPVPLIMLLHGYTASGIWQEQYMEFLPLVDQEGFIYLYPDGTRDALRNRFWNATDACCDFEESQVDDSGYLRALINELSTIYSIDPEKIFIVGHSNGGFMAYRMACDHSDVVSGIASLAGAMFIDPDDCQPEHPVHVLQMHGTSDATILFDGGSFSESRSYPGAEASVGQWIAYNGCLPAADESVPPLDIVLGIPGAETTIRRFREGCTVGGSSELWTINDAPHVPVFNFDFSQVVVDHFFSLESTAPTRSRVRRPTGRRVLQTGAANSIVTRGRRE